MPGDVIDLISSSPPRPPPPRPSKEPEASQTIDLSAFASEFNSTGDLDDPFASSSPVTRVLPRSNAVQPRSSAVGPSRLSHTETGRQPRNPRPSLLADFEIFSDDFDTTGNLDEQVLAEDSGNKRRRLTPSQQATTTRAATDNIDLTTSPPLARRPSPPRCLPRWDLSSPNPFASSPVNLAPTTTTTAIEARSTVNERIRHRSPNPFDSTPPTQDQVPQSHKPDTIGSDVFDSSPRPPAARSITQRRGNQSWDPISSSAPEANTTAPSQHVNPTTHSNRTDVIDIESSSEAGSGSDGSDDDLPDINKLAARPLKQRPRAGLSRSRSDVISTKSRSKPTQSKKTAEERTRERETKAATKEVEKEKKRIVREKEKQEKTREKERAAALAEVNKLRTDKKVSTPEMLVDLPDGLDDTIKTQAETLLEALDVQYTTWQSPVEGAVKWRRKVTSEFNQDLGRWEPIPKRIQAENHVAVLLTADKFVDLALSERLEDHVTKTEEAFPKHQIIYLIEGMIVWMRKNRTLRNRQFTSGVRAQEPTTSTTGRRGRNGTATEYISEDLIEDALLQLQVMHDVLIHHTPVPLETAQWIAIFTQHISTIPYRKQRDVATMGAGFCMESGQVKTGEDAPDSYAKMLQEIARVTAPIAFGVRAEFGSVTKLVNGLVSGGPDRLAEVRKSANKDGAVSDRTIGQAVSKRLHKVFTGRDEDSTDV